MDFKINNRKRILEGFINVDHLEVEFDRFNHQGQIQVERYNLDRPEASCVLLENTSQNTVVIVEQFRFAVASKPGNDGWAYEIIAGLVDKGESSIDAAYRETLEETGYRVKSLEHLYSYFPSIGISNEYVHIYYGKVTDDDKIEDGGGLAAENEDLRIHEISLPDLVEMLKKGEIKDSKTIMAIQWLAARRQIKF